MRISSCKYFLFFFCCQSWFSSYLWGLHVLSNLKHFIFGLVILDCDFISVFGQESVLSGLNECRRGLSWEKPRRKNWLCKIQSFSEWLIFPLIRFKRSLFNCSIVDWISLKRWGVIQFLVFTYYYNSSGLLVVGPCGMVVKMQNQFVVPYQVFQPLEEGETKMPPLQIWHFAFFGNTAANFLPPFQSKLTSIILCVDLMHRNWWEIWCDGPDHTVRKSQIMSKNSIFRKYCKIVNLNFCPKNERFFVIMMHWFLSEFEF